MIGSWSDFVIGQNVGSLVSTCFKIPKLYHLQCNWALEPGKFNVLASIFIYTWILIIQRCKCNQQRKTLHICRKICTLLSLATNTPNVANDTFWDHSQTWIKINMNLVSTVWLCEPLNDVIHGLKRSLANKLMASNFSWGSSIF